MINPIKPNIFKLVNIVVYELSAIDTEMPI